MLLSQLSHLRFRNCLNQGANVATVTSRVKLIKAKPTDFDIVTEYSDNIFCHQSLFEILIKKKMPARITSWLVGCSTIQLCNCLSFRTGHSANNDTKHSSVPSDAKQVFVQLKTKLRIAQRIEWIEMVKHCQISQRLSSFLDHGWHATSNPFTWERPLPRCKVHSGDLWGHNGVGYVTN